MKNSRRACANWQGTDETLASQIICRRRLISLGVCAAFRAYSSCSPLAFAQIATAAVGLYDLSHLARAASRSKCRSSCPPGAAQRDLQLPVWNALYQVRDFAQYVNWVRAKDRSGKALPVHELDKSRWQIQGAEGGAIVELSDLRRFSRPLRRAIELSSRVPQSGADPDVSRRCAVSAAERCVSATFPTDWHIATPLTLIVRRASSPPPNYDRLVDSPVEIGNFRGVRFRRSRRPFPRHRRRRPRRLRHGEDRRRAAQDRRRGHQLDERPSLRHLHVPLSLSARPRGRRHGTRLLHRHRSECRRDEAIAGLRSPASPRTNSSICGTSNASVRRLSSPSTTPKKITRARCGSAKASPAPPKASFSCAPA